MFIKWSFRLSFSFHFLQLLEEKLLGGNLTKLCWIWEVNVFKYVMYPLLLDELIHIAVRTVSFNAIFCNSWLAHPWPPPWLPQRLKLWCPWRLDNSRHVAAHITEIFVRYILVILAIILFHSYNSNGSRIGIDDLNAILTEEYQTITLLRKLEGEEVSLSSSPKSLNQ